MRPKNYFVLLMLALMLVIPCQATALTPMHDMHCDSCHIPGYTNAQLENGDVCMTCHGDKFVAGDASNLYGTNPAHAEQTSHSWLTSSTNPAAGAAEPIKGDFPGMFSRSGATNGKLKCSRCHNVHGLDSNLTLMPDSTATRGAAPMEPIDLCKACHKAFDDVGPLDHGLASHPVGMSYAAANAANDSAYVNDPAAGPGELILGPAGEVNCLTCHGTHATDSDAGTLDGFAGAPGAGDGLILKHNGPSKEDPLAANGICQACHIYEGHAMGGADKMGCMVCHGGHEYDGTAPNYYMLKKQISLPSVPNQGGAAGTVTLDYTVDPTTTTNYDNNTGVKGALCLSCHDLPPTHVASANCADCHNHNSATGSFGAGCGSCHGYAPSIDAPGNGTSGGFAFGTGTLNDYSAAGPAIYKDESTTPHARHANGAGNYTFGCIDCHGTGSGNLNDLPGAGDHDGGTFQQVLNLGIGSLTSLTSAGGTFGSTYNTGGSGSCSAVYCHSNGTSQRLDNPVSIAAVAATPWANGKDTILLDVNRCTLCHDIGGVNDTPTHDVHIGSYDCVICHSDTATNATTLTGTAIGTTHVNGSVDVVFSGIATNATTTAYGDTNGTCSTYCHSSGQAAAPAPVQNPDWDLANTGDCGDCHGTELVSPDQLSGAHETHFTQGVTACTTCHIYTGISAATHIDTTIDLVANACNTCHGATAGETTGADRIPIWVDDTSVDCATCHTGAAISDLGGATGAGSYMDVAAFYITGHGDAGLTAAPDCTGCHDPAAAGHFNGDSADDRLIGAAASDDVFCNSCHGTQNSHFPTAGTSIDGSDCNVCHNPHGEGMGSNTDVMLTIGTGFLDRTDPTDYFNAGNTGVCQVCHVAGEGTGGIDHYNQTDAPDGHNAAKVCTDCHGHDASPVAFAAGAGTNCNDCHGFPPADNTHAAHTTTVDGDILNEDNTDCASCHTGADLYTYANGDDLVSGVAGRENHSAGQVVQVATLLASTGYNETNKDCATACHIATTTNGGVWAAGTVLDCNACHYQAADPSTAGNNGDANSISAESHNKHFGTGGAVVCTTCHDAVTDTSHISNAAGTEGAILIDKAAAVQDEATVNAANGFNDVADTCSTASCHNDARPGADVPTEAWGSDQANCTQCHLASPTTGSHGVHILDDSNCQNCHDSAIKDSTYNDPSHLDGNIDLSAGGYPTDRAKSTGFTNCTTATCHDDGRGSEITGTWGTPRANCGECHAVAPITGSHTSHLDDAAVGCGDCHTGAAEGSTAPTADHRDGNTNAVGYPVTTNGGAFTNCTTAACHDTGRNSSGLTGTWGTPKNNCSECHETVPTTGGHGIHVGVTFGGALAGNTIACGDCHAGSAQGTTAPSADHRDGNVNATGYPVQANGSTFTNCTTASCHQTGQAVNDYTDTIAWGADAANCTQCHAASPSTGSHTKHLTSSNCSACHTNADKNVSYVDAAHGDGNVDVAVGTYTPNKAYGSTVETCDSISCHSDGYSGVDGSTPAWGTPSGCAACHLDGMTRGSHSAHLADNNDCGTCHGDTVKSVSAPSGVHANSNVDVYDIVAGDLGYPTTAAYGLGSWTTCSAASCHNDGRAPNDTPAWGATPTTCLACHEAIPSTGSHASHVADAAVTCGDCHTDAVQEDTVPSIGHRDGNIDVEAGSYPTNKAKTSAFTNCTTASCHDDGRGSATTGAWGTARANCAECHAVAPITGSHTAHLSDTLMNVACDDCHTGVTEGSIAGAGHRDGNIDTVAGLGNTANKVLGTGFETCATASCHNDGRNSGLTAVWGTTRNNCSDCHATVPATGSHTTHLANYACATCHTGTTQGTTAGAGHLDGFITAAASTGLNAKAKGTTYESCGTNNCHGSGSPVWGDDLSANDECTQCHGQMVASATDAQKAPGGSGVDTNGDSLATDAQVGAHQIHLNPTSSLAVACVACHVVPATITAAGHIDSALPAEITWGGLATSNSTTPVSCATTYCHDGGAIKNGWDGGTLAPTWTDTNFMQGTVADCDNCHGYPPAGAHSTSTNCEACHDTMNADNLTFTAAGKLTHVDGNVNASGGDNCSDCHAADIDGVLSGVHGSHTDTAAYLIGKTLSGNDYGGADWYDTTYVNGQPVFGCGQCHPANETATHPSAGLNLDIDPAGETPGAGNIKLLNTVQSTPTFASRSSITCASVYCHSDADGAFKTTLNWYGGALPTDGTECASCHGNSPTTAAHGVHEVGIHYEELYDDDGVGLMAVDPTQTGASGGTDAAHGNAATSSTINCFTCHSVTVTDSANAANTTCDNCHTDGNSIITGNEIARISTSSSTHINGVKDVDFADLTLFKSKAQLRDNLSDADDGGNVLSNIWNRITGYKGAGDYDTAQAAFGTPVFTQGPDTCSTVACHNGNAATWSDAAVDCMYCHTSLPK